MLENKDDKAPPFVERRQPDVLEQADEKRVYDPRFKAYALKVNAGDCVITRAEDEMLVTVLGSCVSACIRDPVLGVGGMNHFLLPGTMNLAEGQLWENNSDALRYGHYAMEKLINEVLKLGARRDRLEIKLFGGASVVKAIQMPIGENNIAFVHRYLQAENLPVASEDLGGLYPRRIHYFVKTGKIFRLLMRRSDDAAIFRRELSAQQRLSQHGIEGSVELFQGVSHG